MARAAARGTTKMWITALAIGLGVGILVGLMGIGGGVVLVPAMVYLLGMNQHLAQGTSLFLQLPPVGLGALYEYSRKGQVDWRAGWACAGGMLAGGYLGSVLAIHTSSRHLRALFGVFLMVSALMLWLKERTPQAPKGQIAERHAPLWAVFAMGTGVGILAGLFGVGGGALLVAFLVLLFGFRQHLAQGTSLLALVPPTGLLAFLNYWHAGEVSWKVGLLLIPGVFVGGILGSRWAQRVSPGRLRRAFAILLLLLGAWQALAS